MKKGFFSPTCINPHAGTCLRRSRPRVVHVVPEGRTQAIVAPTQPLRQGGQTRVQKVKATEPPVEEKSQTSAPPHTACNSKCSKRGSGLS